jgi:hypothetical protein
MLQAGELPPGECIFCGHRNANLIPFFAVCERQYVKERKGASVGFSIGPIFVPMESEEGSVEHHGRDLVVPVPIRVCEPCRDMIPSLASGRGMRIVAAVGLGLSVLCLILVPWTLAVAMTVLSVALFVASRILPAIRQKSLRTVLARVSAYAELFDKYPDAAIIKATSKPNAGT